jgi:hypothetical protein
MANRHDRGRWTIFSPPPAKAMFDLAGGLRAGPSGEEACGGFYFRT